MSRTGTWKVRNGPSGGASSTAPGGGTSGPTKEYFTGLGELYVADPRFGANYGGQAGAEFVRDAMAIYAERNL